MTNLPGARPHGSSDESRRLVYFQFGEAVNWLDRTVRVPSVNSLTREQWMDEYRRCKKGMLTSFLI